MANKYASTLAALAPDVSYAMDEADGIYLNVGSGGSADIPGAAVPTDYIAPQLPGIIKDSPAEYGCWRPDNATAIRWKTDYNAAGVPLAAGWTTGTWSVLAIRFNQAEGDDFTPFSQTLHTTTVSNTIGNSWNITIDTDGRLSFNIGTTNAQAGADWISWLSTDIDIIEDCKPYNITAVQRADDTGFHVFVNGVEIDGTTTWQATSYSMDINSCVDARFSDVAFDELSLVLGGILSGAGEAIVNRAIGIVQRPAIWRNVALTDSQIQKLHASALLDQIPQDYFEWFLDRFANIGSDGFLGRPEYLNFGAAQGGANLAAADNMMEAGLNVTEANRMRWTGSRNGRNLTAGPDIPTSIFPTYYQRASDSSSYQTGGNSSVLNASTGTMSMLITISEGLGVDGTVKPIMSVGKGTGSTDDNIQLWVGQTPFGLTLIITMGRMGATNIKSGDYWQFVIQASDGGFLTGDYPELAMLTLVQDGTGVRLYKNDVELTIGVVTSSGTLYDELSWWNTMGTSSAMRYTGGYTGSNNHAENMDIHHNFVIEALAMSQAQISEMWDAVNGIFPTAENVNLDAPDGGFFDTITDILTSDPSITAAHYWRHNALASSDAIDDVIETTESGDSVVTGGNPAFRVEGPLLADPTNFAIFYDGQGDYFEIGVAGITGVLVGDITDGTVGFFFKPKALGTKQYVYSQANDAGTAYIRFFLDAANKFGYEVEDDATGDTAEFLADVAITDTGYHFVVFTYDSALAVGEEPTLYIDGAAVAATLSGSTTGDAWFNYEGGLESQTVNSAVAALATSPITFAAEGRISELFITDLVFTDAQIAALWELALEESASANTDARLVFEDVIFKNGGFADIAIKNGDTEYGIALQVDNCQFLGGEEAEDAQSVYLEGAVEGQISGSLFDLQADPTTGRAAVVGTTEDPTAAASVYGNVRVTGSTFSRMGYYSKDIVTEIVTVRSPVFAESGFGLQVGKNRFLDCFGSAVGWRGDARGIQVVRNLIDVVSSGVAAIYGQAGLNTNIGNGWLIDRNTILDVADGGGILLNGATSSGTQFARNIRIGRNTINNMALGGMGLASIRDATVLLNTLIGGTEGIRFGDIQGMIAVLRNSVEDQSAEALILDQGSTQQATLILDRNSMSASLLGDGPYIDGIDQLIMTNNELINLAIGLQLGEVGTSAKIAGNKWTNVTTALDLIDGTVQNGFEWGINYLESFEGEDELTVLVNAITVFADYHTITSASAVDLQTITASHNRTGALLVLNLATGSSDITVTDADNVAIDTTVGEFTMDQPGISQMWLLNDGAGNWKEVSRANGTNEI